MPRAPGDVGKQVHPTCAFCDAVERNYSGVVWAVRAIVHGNPTPDDVRAYRRWFERDLLTARRRLEQAHPDYARIADSDDRRAWLNGLWRSEVERHPELRVAAHRPWVPMNGLVLYVLAAVVATILEHDASLAPIDRKAHFADGTMVAEIVQLGRAALTARRRTRPQLGIAGLERRVLARLVGLEEKLIRLRLRQAPLRGELAAACWSGWIDLVSWNQLRAAAAYFQDWEFFRELARPRTGPSRINLIDRLQRERHARELLTVPLLARRWFVQLRVKPVTQLAAAQLSGPNRRPALA